MERTHSPAVYQPLTRQHGDFNCDLSSLEGLPINVWLMKKGANRVLRVNEVEVKWDVGRRGGKRKGERNMAKHWQKARGCSFGDQSMFQKIDINQFCLWPPSAMETGKGGGPGPLQSFVALVSGKASLYVPDW